ncbi:MAG TPA: sensor domain-containing protein [Streptosporangiaceae bacterium]|nr:sensor domain-containing protein [Streptosporangiaceae bacterium]
MSGGTAIRRTAESGLAGRLEGRPWAPVQMARDPMTWRNAVYLLVSMAFGLFWFIFLTVGISLSLGLTLIWVGIPLLALVMLTWRGGAMIERRLMWAAFGAEIPSPYRPMPPGRNLVRKWGTLAADPATWKDLVYLALLFPITLAEFVVSVAVWATTAALLTLPVTVLFGNVLQITTDRWVYVVDDPVEALPWSAVGVLTLVVAMYAVRVMGIGHVAYARLLLGPSEKQALRARAEHLQASRARGVDAAEAERRRIERDLHDGAQQQLLAVAMDLGRARAKLDEDPETARQLIELAHSGTKEAIAELRNLARGIYPAILTDRGLDAALSALAARAPVPVDVEVELPGERPPAAVESIAYFVVAEALTNVAKYARATRATVRVVRDHSWIIVEISDNGVGGATRTPGGGLAGLADRAAGIDGILTVNSPVGGPTVIRADLPCAW